MTHVIIGGRCERVNVTWLAERGLVGDVKNMRGGKKGISKILLHIKKKSGDDQAGIM